MKSRKLRSAAAVTALCALVTVPVVAEGAGSALAQASVTTQTYEIGNGSVTKATATVNPGTAGSTGAYAVSFITPSALAKGATITVTDPTGATSFPSAANDYAVVDRTSSSAAQVPSAVQVATGGHSVTLQLTSSIGANSSVTVNIAGAANPSKTGMYDLEVSTSANPGPATTSTYAISAPALAFSASATPALVGATSTYTVGNFKAASALSAGDFIEIASSAGSGTSDNVGLPNSASSYRVEDVTTGRSSTPSAVTVSGAGSSATGESVSLELPTAIASGDELAVTITGVHNPTSDQTDTISAAAPRGASAATSTLLIGTSVTNAGIALSNSAGDATGVSYRVEFKLTSGLAAGGVITVVSPPGTSFTGASVTVVDLNHPAASAKVPATAVKATTSGPSATDNKLAVSVPTALTAGDTVYLEITGVTNPSPGGYGGSTGDVTVATGPDAVPATLPAYTVGTPAPAPAASVKVSPTSAGRPADYTIGDLRATSTLVAGQSTIELKAPAGTVFASSASDYTVTDLTHSYQPGHPVPLSGGGTNDIVLKVSTNISSGDYLDISAADVLNPGPGDYTMSVLGDLEASVTPPPPTPVVVSRTALSVQPNPVLVGGRVTLTAIVAPAVSQGTVSFLDNGRALAGCSSVAVHDGKASCTTTYTTLGRDTLQATYKGTTGVRPSFSTDINLNVTNSARLSLSASPNPARVGQVVTYTATVVPAANRGTVTFRRDGTVVPNCSAVPVSNGRATCALTYWAGGRSAVTARYSGTTGVAPTGAVLADQSVIFPAAGYWLVTRNGAVYGLGGASSMGDLSVSAATGPAVGIASTPTAKGYWVVTSKGTVGAFGDAHFYGDLPAMRVNAKDIVAIAPTRDGHGYWLVGRDGGMFAFGDAKFHGSVPGLGLHVKDVVGMVASTDGKGYLVVGSDGGVFTFGSARFHGSLPGIGKHVHDIQAILPSTSGGGYVLVGADGGAFVFGSGVHFQGSLPGKGIKVHDIVGLALTTDDQGYYMAGNNGRVYGFGDAEVFPTPSALVNTSAVVAIAGT